MHEFTIAKNIIDTAENAALGKKINSIHIEMGEIADIPPSDLLDALKLINKECIYDVVEIESVVKCSCGFEGRPKILEKKHATTIFVCPECNNIPQIVSGNEINVVSVDVED